MNKRSLHIILLLLHILVILFLLIQTYGKALRTEGYDFTNYLNSAEALSQGLDPRESLWPDPYFLPFFFIPLTLLPYSVAVFLWFSINISALFIIFQMVKESFILRYITYERTPALLLQTSVFLLMLPIIQNDLLNGQINLIILLLCLLFLRQLYREQPYFAALALALAINLKITPLIFILYLLLRKEFYVLFLTFLFTILLGLLPILIMGSSIFSAYWDYFQYLLYDQFQYRVNIPHNIFLGLNDLVDFLLPGSPHPLLSWLVKLAWMIMLISVDLHQRKNGVPLGDLWMFCLYLISILLLSPLSETHHMVLLIPPVYLFTLIVFIGPIPYLWNQTLLYGLFWFLLYAGKYNKQGPFAFLALLILSGAILDILWNWKHRGYHLSLQPESELE